MSQHFILGPWIFDSSIGTLIRGDEIIRLENRASKLLAILCDRQDSVVSHDEIIDAVWEGRNVSSNSVAVVIGDIRRALGDAAKNPTYIQTVPKRGYRLLVSAEKTTPTNTSDGIDLKKPWWRPNRALGTLLVGGIFAVILITTVGFNKRLELQAEPPKVSLLSVVNGTGEDQYAPMTLAYTDLILVNLTRSDNISVVSKEQSDMQVAGQLIVWDGQLAMSLALTDTEETVLWSGMAPGPKAKLANQVASEVRAMLRTIDQSN